MVHEANPSSPLRQARIDAGFTIEAAAWAAGCSVSTVQRAESGAHRTRSDIVARLAVLYGASLDALIAVDDGGTAPAGRGKPNGDATTAAKRSRVPAVKKEE